MMFLNDYFIVVNSGMIAELENLEFYIFSNDFLVLNDAVLTSALTIRKKVSITLSRENVVNLFYCLKYVALCKDAFLT